MKKTMMFLGVLSLGLAHAQQNEPYEGKVGVNTETPSATLNVKSKTGTTKDTKNFELENANGTKMVTVLDNGNVGVNIQNPYYKFEVNQGVIASIDGGIYSIGKKSLEGSPIYIVNETKTEEDKARIWGIFNMTGHYGTGLHFFQYNGARSKNQGSKMMLSDQGFLGVGKFTEERMPTERLDIVGGNIRVRDLANSVKRLVYADSEGVLRLGDSTERANQVGSESNLVCNEDSRGKMNFKKAEDGKSDVFGVCLKNKDGNYYWGYMVGGNHPFNGTGAFGTGLQ